MTGPRPTTTRAVLRVWSRVVSPATPLIFLVVLGIVCFADAATHPRDAVWPILGVICAVLVAAGAAVIALRIRSLRRETTARHGADGDADDSRAPDRSGG